MLRRPKELDHLKAHELNETLTRLAYERFVRSGDTVLDLGANHGEHTRELSRLVSPTGLVHAFEPNQDLFSALASIPNVRVWPHAAGDDLSIQTLHIPTGLDGWASLKDIRGEVKRDFKLQSVVQVRIDDLLEIKDISFVKIDVERREIFALRGMQELIKTSRPLIVLENATQEIRDLFGQLNYCVSPFSEQLELSNQIASPQEKPFLLPESVIQAEVDRICFPPSKTKSRSSWFNTIKASISMASHLRIKSSD